MRVIEAAFGVIGLVQLPWFVPHLISRLRTEALRLGDERAARLRSQAIYREWLKTRRPPGR